MNNWQTDMDKDDKISLNCSFLYQNKEGFSLLRKNLSYITLKLIASKVFRLLLSLIIHRTVKPQRILIKRIV